MAISLRAMGTPSNGVDTFSPAIPAGAAAGDMMLLLAGGKPYNLSWSAGWTQLSEYSDGTTAAGNGTGSMKVTAWWKQHTGSESNPTITEGVTTWNVVEAIIVVFQKAAGETWSTPVMVGAIKPTTPTTVNVTCDADPGITAGDAVVTWGALRDNTSMTVPLTPNSTGVGFTNTEDPSPAPGTNTGGNMTLPVTRSTVDSGTSSAAPTITGTIATSESGSFGMIRLRVAAATYQPRHGFVSYQDPGVL